MSGFFSTLQTNIPRPDVVMNSGPLPSQDPSGWPVGFNANPDGRIGEAPTLLGGVKPYSYGGPDRLSTQAAYLNIPHVTQRLVPAIVLPSAGVGSGTFTLSHQVDDGDIAFVVRIMFSPYEMVKGKKSYARQGVMHAIDPVINLSTANYLLHGLQRYITQENGEWKLLWTALGGEKKLEGMSDTMRALDEKISDSTLGEKEILQARFQKKQCMRRIANFLISDVIKPFGVPRGSEKQGGQHQGLINKSVTWPVDLVTSMVVDGRVINMVNFWRKDAIDSGDDLLFYLGESSQIEYVLSHHHGNSGIQKFPPLDKAPSYCWKNETNRHESHWHMKSSWNAYYSKTYSDVGGDPNFLKYPTTTGPDTVFQLFPGVKSSNSVDVQRAIWNTGYWHIARSQVMQFKHEESRNIITNATSVLNGNLLQATFEPTWMDPLVGDSGRPKKIRRVDYDDYDNETEKLKNIISSYKSGSNIESILKSMVTPTKALTYGVITPLLSLITRDPIAANYLPGSY
jgi:hypothetical protein